jgi:hypothetical protein
VTARRAALLAGAVMLLVYIATLAPSVTFWDAGEFIAAARTLGIPHPPGTPLFIVLLNSWARALWFIPFAVATNLFSAVCTAAALALAAWWIARATSAPWFALAGAVAAGAMSSVWQNATETEVYAASLLLAVSAIAAGDHAGRFRDARWTTLAAYLLALAIPLHLSALVAAPVVVYLAAQPHAVDAFDWRTAIALTGVSAFVVGVSRVSLTLCVISAAVVVASSLGVRNGVRRVVRPSGIAMVGAMLVACSAVLILVVRARHDPAINQANPTAFRDLAYVIGRRQYDVAGILPRQAPPWLQIANWFEYADWQVALSLAPSVIPTFSRVVATLAFAGLGLVGAGWHRRTDRRTWRAVLLLFLCGSAGVIAYVNLKAGTSFAWSFVPDAAHHEARDRDYFFVLGFLAWGLWAGMGAMALAERWHVPRVVGLGVAALPLVLNWGAVSRRAEPEASLPREFAVELLDPLPQNAVLFVGGDNDTYPLWFEQQVNGRRRDVTIITIPLLGAAWYADEMARRHHLGGQDRSGGTLEIARRIAASARALHRPVAVSLTVSKDERARLGDAWVVSGLVAVERAEGDSSQGALDSGSTVIPVSRVPTEAARARIEKWRAGRTARSSIEPVHEYYLRVLSCPDIALQRRPSAAQLVTLDSLCNLR